MDQNLKRDIILDNYSNPNNKGLVDDESYVKVNMNNTSCIDELDIQMLIEDDEIKDIHFDGEACAICTSSASIMTKELSGKTLDEAIEVVDNFYNMIDEKDYDSSILGEANVYEDTYKQPNRKKCALLAWWGAKKCMDEHVK